MRQPHKSKKGWGAFFTTLTITMGFVFLMVYALKRNPNNIPSQLIGKPAPTIEGPLAQGGQFPSQHIFHQNRWVVINFWNTSCFVCRYEAPDLERFYRTTLNDDTQPLFISINIQDSSEVVLEYAKSYGLSFPIVTDLSGRISLDYGVYGTPETFFIDPSGVVRERVAGSVDFETLPRFIEVLSQNAAKNPITNDPKARKTFGAL